MLDYTISIVTKEYRTYTTSSVLIDLMNSKIPAKNSTNIKSWATQSNTMQYVFLTAMSSIATWVSSFSHLALSPPDDWVLVSRISSDNFFPT